MRASAKRKGIMKENLYGYGAIALWLMGILVLLSAFWWY
jgi:hypothetical protein